MRSFQAFPHDWNIKELNNAKITIIDGDRGTNYPSKSEFSSEGYCLFLNTGNIKNDCFDFASCDFINENKDALLRKGKLQRGDIVLTTRGTVGSVAYFHKNIPYEHIRINSGMVVLRCAEDVSPDYFYHLFKSPLLKTQYSLYSSGSAQPQLPIKDLKRIKLPIPSSDVQKKIAAILSAYDDFIENNQRRVALLEKMAEEIYREWFVRLRFPGYEKVKVVKGLPEGWESTPLTLLADITYGYAFDGARFNAQGVGKPIIRIRNIINSNITEFTDEVPSDKYIVKCGDLLVGMDGEFHINHWINEDGYLVQRVCRINPKSERIRGYLAQAIKAPIKHFESILQGATVGHLGSAHLKTINLLNPPESMNKYLEILNSLLDQKIAISRINLGLSKTRDLLLPRLISGKLSVEHLDIQFPPSMQDDVVTPETHQTRP